MDCARYLHWSSCLRLLRPPARAAITSSVVTVVARVLARASTAAEGVSVLAAVLPRLPLLRILGGASMDSAKKVLVELTRARA